MLRFRLAALALLAGAAAAPAQPPATPLPRLKVSENKRFLVTEGGKPFFYLADTAWELFHRLTREEADAYLKDRASKGFTATQAVILAEEDGLHTPNAYGHTPLANDDPAKPNEAYFAHVDWVVDCANRRGLYVALLPTWGDKWHKKGGAGPEVFTDPKVAAAYGEYVGRRYKDKGVIWVLGGDRSVETDTHRAVIRAMAGGLKAGDGGTHLATFHPNGASSSTAYFPADEWLDFHMRQNGHGVEFTGRYDQTRADYDRTPVKPVVDGEPVYEDHPVSFDAKNRGVSVAADCRRAVYWDLFGGACGHTYGHHAVWQFYAPGRKPVNGPLMPWAEAIQQPGAGQMQHARRLVESRPYLTRIPDDTVIVPDAVPTAVPGAGTRRFGATRDEAGTFVMVYVPVGRAFTVKMDAVKGPLAHASWYNPRNGAATAFADYPTTGTRRFTPPDPGELLDWVLVLDDAAKKYPPPGQ